MEFDFNDDIEVPENHRNISIRRNLEQAKHCLEEALSIVNNKEDLKCALDDVKAARDLLVEVIIPRLQIEID